MKRRSVLASTAGAVLIAGAVRAAGPPLRLVVAYPPGGISDEVARALAGPMSALLGRPVRVEHRPGAGGAIAMEMLSRAPADGSVLVFCAVSPLTLLPLLGPTPYDPQRDIAPVAAVMATPVLVLGTPALAALDVRDLPGLLALAGARPGRVRWATSGTATTGHLVLVQLARSAGVDIVHVPYKGGGQQLNDALGGQFEVLSSNVSPATLQYVQAGRLMPLAVGATERAPALPAVPTLAEAGHPSANRQSLFGLFAPGGTPAATVDTLNAAIGEALRDPILRGRLLDAHNLPLTGSADDFVARIAAESASLQHLLAQQPMQR